MIGFLPLVQCQCSAAPCWSHTHKGKTKGSKPCDSLPDDSKCDSGVGVFSPAGGIFFPVQMTRRRGGGNCEQIGRFVDRFQPQRSSTCAHWQAGIAPMRTTHEYYMDPVRRIILPSESPLCRQSIGKTRRVEN